MEQAPNDLTYSLRVMRAMFPPWGNLEHPLVRYGIKHHQQRRTWGLVLMAYAVLGIWCFYMIGLINDPDATNSDTVTDVIITLCSIMLGLGLLYSWAAHVQLFFHVSRRSAALIAQMRERGDWELISITPISKTRWLFYQTTAIGWQSFPHVRQLMVTHALLSIPLAIVFTYSSYESWQNGFTYGDEYYLHPVIALGAAIPIFLLMIAEPLLAVGVFIASSLRASSQTKRSSMAILSSFAWVGSIRYIGSLVAIHSAVFYLLLLNTIGRFLGIDGTDDPDISGLELLFYIGYTCMLALMFVALWDWLPLFTLLILLVSNDTTNFLMIGSTIAVMGILGQIIVPILSIGWLHRQAVQRLKKRA